ncbi:transposase [Alkanindiges illinoisensis]|nr:transposase [Alkanindiges illinoisensis]
MQAMIHYKTGQILSTCFAKGRVHDFKLFKISMKFLNFKPFVLADKGYLGLAKIGFTSLLPFKATKRQPLDPYLKHINKEINRRRIKVEHTFGALKRFNILSSPYRNRRSRISLRFNLIAAIFNLELVKR